MLSCLLSPAGDDPIFVGINRLVTKGLTNCESEEHHVQYPCHVVNRFQCPYERGANENDANIVQFDVDYLFRLFNMAFAVEISLAKATKEDSEIRIKSKEELLHALTDENTFVRILNQGNKVLEDTEDLKKYSIHDIDYVVTYFMRIKDQVNLEWLRFY